MRSRQDRYGDRDGDLVVPIAIHGDAAFAGQGVVMETFNMADSRGFSTKGTIHIIINNQIGFTTSNAADARSTLYASDVAKMINAPIFHVNGDDPEAVHFVTQLAIDFRMAFKKDVVIDLVCYRRHGHNETDEPSVTQPMMYGTIKSLATTRKLYAERLVEAGVLSAEEADAMVDDYRRALDAGETVAPDVIEGLDEAPELQIDWSRYAGTDWRVEHDPRVPLARLQELAAELATLPDGLVLHSRVKKIVEDRRKMSAGALPLDWGYAETMAYATLVDDGYDVRLSGQDSGRGTFAHRHAVLHNQKQPGAHVPLRALDTEGTFLVIDSVLSEEAVLAFEYGYATADPNTLVIWEAQFGDFANGAQVVIDQFISSGETKWGRLCGLTMLLPHGYEGQGPEHSSARLERFLQLCAEDNMQVLVPSTPAQAYHMLRRQMIRPMRRPMIVMTPKSLLRHRLATSTLDGSRRRRLPVGHRRDRRHRREEGRAPRLLQRQGLLTICSRRAARRSSRTSRWCGSSSSNPFPYDEMQAGGRRLPEGEVDRLVPGGAAQPGRVALEPSPHRARAAEGRRRGWSSPVARRRPRPRAATRASTCSSRSVSSRRRSVRSRTASPADERTRHLPGDLARRSRLTALPSPIVRRTPDTVQDSRMSSEIKVPTLPESIADALIVTWHKQPGGPGQARRGARRRRDRQGGAGGARRRGRRARRDHRGGGDDRRRAPGDRHHRGGRQRIGRRRGGRATTGRRRRPPTRRANRPTRARRRTRPAPRRTVTREEETGKGGGQTSPSVRKLLAEHDLSADDVRGSGKNGRISKADVERHVANAGRHRLRRCRIASRGARRERWCEKGKAGAKDKGKGKGGGAAPAKREGKAGDGPLPIGGGAGGERTERARADDAAARARIAERLLQAVADDGDADDLQRGRHVRLHGAARAVQGDVREEPRGQARLHVDLPEGGPPRRSSATPDINASIDGDEIVYHGYCDIGVAVSSERGLVVPVLRSTEHMSLADMERAIGDYAEKARSGKLGVDDMTGGTFTVSNGGVFGSMMSTPILNPPQSAILGMHATQERAVVVNGEIVIRPMMYVALSYDHRIVDGKGAVGFLKTIKEIVEEPGRVLFDV